MKILIVDDSEEVRQMLTSLLAAAGYFDLVTAASAAGGYAILGIDDESNTGQRVDLILMDIKMPKINGIQACRLIKENVELNDIPIVMVTALDQSDSWNEAFEAGTIDYIAKPPRNLELRPRVRSALALKREMDARKRSIAQLEEKNKQLEAALDTLKILHGLLPICSYCKNIRDDSGYWSQVEAYIDARTLRGRLYARNLSHMHARTPSPSLKMAHRLI